MASKKKSKSSSKSTVKVAGKNQNLGTAKGQVAATAAANQEAINANRPNVNTAYGNESWQRNPDGSWTQNQTLNSAEQSKLEQDRQRDIQFGDMSKALQGQWNQKIQDPYSLSGIKNDPNQWDWQNAQGIANDYAGKVNDSFETLNGKRFDKQGADLKSQLLNSGIPVGSELYNNQMQALQDNQGRERLGMQTQALDTGMNWAGQSFGMGQQARQGAIGDYERQRNAPYQELSQALQARGGVNNPQFQGRSEAAPTDYVGAYNTKDQIDYARNNRSFGGGGGGAAPAAPYIPYAPEQFQQPKQPSAGTQLLYGIGSSIAAGVGQGVGSAVGKGVGNWMSGEDWGYKG